MFTIAFRDESDVDQIWTGCPVLNEEYLCSTYKEINICAKIGQSFMDFVSITGDIFSSGHPYIALAGEAADNISENSWFLDRLRRFLDLGIENETFFTLQSFMYFLHLTGMQVPAFHHELVYQPGHEDDCIEDLLPENEEMDHFERSMRAYVSAGSQILTQPLMVYDCNTIEDACIASLHFLIVHQFHIRKCKNCGKYFIAYYRSDTEYCDRISPYKAQRTCKEDGRLRTYAASVDGDVVKKTLKKIESARRMRVWRNPGNWDMDREFQEWKDSMNEQRQAYKSGSITAEQFLAWLEEHKSYASEERG